jgi:excisionase family DNA binding protein
VAEPHITSVAQADDSVPGQLWTIREAAHYLHIPISAIYKMTAPKARMRIPHLRIAGRLRFRRSALDEWLDVLTVSNIPVLQKAKSVARRVSRGINSQEEAP